MSQNTESQGKKKIRCDSFLNFFENLTDIEAISLKGSSLHLQNCTARSVYKFKLPRNSMAKTSERVLYLRPIECQVACLPAPGSRFATTNSFGSAPFSNPEGIVLLYFVMFFFNLRFCKENTKSGLEELNHVQNTLCTTC